MDDVRQVAARTLAAARSWGVELGRLVIPVECAGCGLVDVPWCPPCASAFDGAPRRCELDAPRLDRMDGEPPPPVWALATYDGPVREAVLAWKDHGRADLTGRLESAVATAAETICDELRDRTWHPGGSWPPGTGLLVVPAPSSARNRRRRGADLTGGLATAVAGAVASRGWSAVDVALLAKRRGTRDQAGLSSRARGANLTGRVRVRRGFEPTGWPVLLVDDVLTTGATFVAAQRALAGAGAVVVGGLVLAATPPPSGARTG